MSRPLPAHGTNARYAAGCTCAPCRSAHAADRRAARRALAYGTWRPFVDAEPSSRRIRELRAAGCSWPTLTSLTGLSPGVLIRLVQPCGREGRVSTKVRPATERAILAVTVDTLTPATPEGGGAEALRLVLGGRSLLDAADATGVRVASIARAGERSPDPAVRRLVAEALKSARVDGVAS